MTTPKTLATLENAYLRFVIAQGPEGFVYTLTDLLQNVRMADMDYNYAVTLWNGTVDSTVTGRTVSRDGDRIRVQGEFAQCGLRFEQTFEMREGDRWLYEDLTATNVGAFRVVLKDLNFGLRKMLFKPYEGWCDHLDAYAAMSAPTRRYRSQRIDRYKYEYTANDILYPKWGEGGDSADGLPGYFDEAWIWAGENGGLISCKYNRDSIEYTRLERQAHPLPGRGCENVAVLYGGTAIFDGNPEAGLSYEPGACYRFGSAKYTAFRGGFEEGYYAYRSHLDALGHGLPANYDPPVHWNELYNLGWFAEKKEGGMFSDDPDVQLYSLEQLYDEARLAKEAGAESLYLDPGWDLYPGSCVWDEKRLGKFKDFTCKLHNEIGIKVALHLMMTFTSDDEIEEFYCRSADACTGRDSLQLYRVCANEVWVREKTARLLKLVDDGVDFFMFDFPDYGDLERKGCMDPNHGHEVPMRRQTHVDNVMRVIHNVKKRNPNVLIEAHDRIVGGVTEYHQMYFQHGGENTFDENWGYEYMWNPMLDLMSEKAVSLYEYNMACSIPLYLHINEHGDNGNLLALWWYISVVKHLGIGGVKREEAIFPVLQAAMELYHANKRRFTNGVFYGLERFVHLHVLPEDGDAALSLFNPASEDCEKTVRFDAAKYGVRAGAFRAYSGTGGELPVSAELSGGSWTVTVSVKALSPVIVTIQ